MNERGSLIILLVIAIALVITLGALALNLAMSQYEIKRFNTESTQAFYMSETGLNEAYVRTCKLIDEAIRKSAKKAEEYLEANPSDTIVAEDIFATSYKSNITSNIINQINTVTNPSVKVEAGKDLIFTDNKLIVLIRSSYITENNLEKLTWVELTIKLPEYKLIKDGIYNVANFIELGNWRS